MTKFLSLICLYCLTSCASVSFYTPNNRFISPENSGDSFSGKFGVGYGSKAKIILVDALCCSTPSTESPRIRVDDGLYAQAEMSLVPVVDIFYGNSGLGAKVQFLGDPEKTAKKGNFSVATAIARDVGKRTESDGATFNDTTYKNEGTANYELNDLMAIVGYRPSDSTTVYLNIANTLMKADGSVRKSVTTGSKTDSTVIDVPKQKGQSLSMLIGVQFSSEHFYWMIEPGYSKTQWKNATSKERLVLGTTVGFKW